MCIRTIGPEVQNFDYNSINTSKWTLHSQKTRRHTVFAGLLAGNAQHKVCENREVNIPACIFLENSRKGLLSRVSNELQKPPRGETTRSYQ